MVDEEEKNQGNDPYEKFYRHHFFFTGVLLPVGQTSLVLTIASEPMVSCDQEYGEDGSAQTNHDHASIPFLW